MSSQHDHPSAISGLSVDIEQLADDAEALAESIDRSSTLAREEAVGAELLASREVVAQLGVAWETMAELGDLYARQARYLVEDNVTTLTGLLDGSAQGRLVEVLGEHVERRVGHIGEGLEQGIDLLSRQSQAAAVALETMWAPFLAVVRQDWKGARAGRRNAGRHHAGRHHAGRHHAGRTGAAAGSG